MTDTKTGPITKNGAWTDILALVAEIGGAVAGLDDTENRMKLLDLVNEYTFAYPNNGNAEETAIYYLHIAAMEK